MARPKDMISGRSRTGDVGFGGGAGRGGGISRKSVTAKPKSTMKTGLTERGKTQKLLRDTKIDTAKKRVNSLKAQIRGAKKSERTNLDGKLDKAIEAFNKVKSAPNKELLRNK